MRRVLRNVAIKPNKTKLGDLTTIANHNITKDIKKKIKNGQTHKQKRFV